MVLIQQGSGDAAEMLRTTEPVWRRWCERWGLRREVYFGRVDLAATRNPLWDKMALTMQALHREGEGEVVLWVDADALVVDVTQDPREVLPAGACAGMVYRKTAPEHLCTGVMFLRVGAEAAALFARVWEYGPQGVGGPCAALRKVGCRRGGDDEVMQLVGGRTTGEIPTSNQIVAIDPRWNVTPKYRRDAAGQTPIIYHWAGIPRTTVRRRLEESVAKVMREWPS